MPKISGNTVVAHINTVFGTDIRCHCNCQGTYNLGRLDIRIAIYVPTRITHRKKFVIKYP